MVEILLLSFNTEENGKRKGEGTISKPACVVHKKKRSRLKVNTQASSLQHQYALTVWLAIKCTQRKGRK